MNAAATIPLGAVAAWPAMAMACVVQPVQCALEDGRLAVLMGDHSGAVLFEEFDPTGAAGRRVILAECTGRTGVMAEEAVLGADALFEAEGRFLEDMQSDEELTPRDIRARMAGDGIEVALVTLNEGHCGCDMPQMPRPPLDCPAVD